MSTVSEQLTTPVTGTVLVPQHSSIITAIRRAADYYRPTYALTGVPHNDWSWATYFQGV